MWGQFVLISHWYWALWAVNMAATKVASLHSPPLSRSLIFHESVSHSQTQSESCDWLVGLEMHVQSQPCQARGASHAVSVLPQQ